MLDASELFLSAAGCFKPGPFGFVNFHVLRPAILPGTALVKFPLDTVADVTDLLALCRRKFSGMSGSIPGGLRPVLIKV